MDHAATTALRPEAAKAMEAYLDDQYGNPSGNCALSKQARKGVERARYQVSRLVGARPEEIFFTSGGTESDNWALWGTAFGQADKGRHIVTTAIEHPAIGNTCRFLERQGFEVTRIQPERDGIVTLDALRQAVREDTILVSVMMANNEIGTLQPIREIGMWLHHRGILFHTDAVQACGHVPVDVNYLMVDMLSASGHKFGGPKGCGFLYVRSDVEIEPFIHGGGQESGMRSGTENVAGIVGMGEAARAAGNTILYGKRKVQQLRDYMLQQMKQQIPHLQVNGSLTKRLPGNLNISIPGADSRELIAMLDRAGICISARSACSSGKLQGSHVLAALQLPTEYQNGTLRITLGEENTREDADFVTQQLVQALKMSRPGGF